MAPWCWISTKFSNRGPLVTTNFQSFSSKSNKNQDIFLKFSAFVHHMSVQIWQKNSCHFSSSQPSRPILAKTLDASSDCICWDILKRKKLVRFWTYMSHLMEGILNIFKKMAFCIFLPSQGVHLQDVHDLTYLYSIVFTYMYANKDYFVSQPFLPMY